MSQRFTPFLMFGLLVLAMGSALLHRPSPPPASNSHFPSLPLYRLDQPDQRRHWQPEPDGVTLVNFFASWCVPCLAEMPLLDTLRKENVTLIGIAWNDTPQALGRWLKTHGNPYRTIYLDQNGEAAIATGIRGVPETFLIGADGRVKLHIKGALTANQIPALKQQIKEAAHASAAR